MKALPGRVVPSPCTNKWCFTFSIDDNHFISEQTFTITFRAKQAMREWVKELNLGFESRPPMPPPKQTVFPEGFCLNGGEQ